MKKHFAILAGILFCLSCKPSAESAEQSPAPTQAEHIAKIYDAFAAGDVATVVAHMDPGIVWNEAEHFIYADGNPYRGPDAIVEGVFGRLGADFDNFRLEEKEFLNAGDHAVLVTGRYRGTYKATGKELDAQFAHLWKLKDTLAASFQQYTDTWQAQQVATPDAGETEPEEE